MSFQKKMEISSTLENYLQEKTSQESYRLAYTRTTMRGTAASSSLPGGEVTKTRRQQLSSVLQTNGKGSSLAPHLE